MKKIIIEIEEDVIKALKDYVDEVRDLKFPAQENFYEIKDNELEKLLGDSKWKYEKR